MSLQNALLSNRINFSNITSNSLLPLNSSKLDNVSVYDDIYILNGVLFAPNVLITDTLFSLDIRRKINVNFANLQLSENINLITNTNTSDESIENTNVFIKDNYIQVYNSLSIKSYIYSKKYNIT